jgi:hypothetical protein
MSSPTALDLPPYLLATEPMEVSELPLQVALLTGELVYLRQVIAILTDQVEYLLTRLDEIEGLEEEANDA